MDTDRSIWLIGGGGVARGAADTADAAGLAIAGLVLQKGGDATWFSGAILSDDEFLKADFPASALAAIGDNGLRRNAVERFSARRGIRWTSLVHPRASVAPSADIGPGCLVLPMAMIGPNARLGTHVVVYSGCLIEHDGQVGDFASFGPGAKLGGGVSIGEGAFVGLGAMVGHGRSIGGESVVGMGSVVTRDIGPRVVAHGSPCRVVRSREPGERYL